MKIAIYGTVGAGKTTLINYLKQNLPNSYKVFWEPITNNPYFEDSYSLDLELAKAATYKSEIYMLSARYQQFKESLKYENVIYDRGIMDTITFVHCNYDNQRINEVDWNVYSDYFENCVVPSIANNLQNTNGYDLVIYLKVTPETSIKRIVNRGIERELKVDKEFWKLLVKKYDYWYEKLKDKLPFLLIDGNIENPEIYVNKILKLIKKIAK
ncbi:deoxynucleoside kinase [Williamsoniiplasma somnilux]|uniref:Deoxynucleoside kinase n=1 Tax=Williamsoniiplasma somnilux TaxID=215578 RepID=A0A2K8NY05_9MOLU|nr:deoxynucleoside kinase [Williamsoniiplasma somnilux]ATZ18715.1 deoxynucleoside kinase [Williamsoniiplasma somnilux]